MATNLNNIHINSFTKGMNTDTSLDMIGNELYVFGLNVRITSNTAGSTISPNDKEGVITPIDEGDFVTCIDFPTDHTILATASIGDLGAVITKHDGDWYVYKIEKNGERLIATHLFMDAIPENVKMDQVSVVINKEIENVVKLYIADGYHEIMQIDLTENSEYYKEKHADDLISNHYFPSDKLIINKKISGRLHTSQVLYTYRYYKKYGIRSKLAPITHKILIIDSNRDKEIGNAEDTETSIGLQLKIAVPTTAKSIFDHVQVYRLSYLKPNTNAEIDLIHDSKIDGDLIIINDTGIEALLKLSIEEFAALDTMDMVPKCIEQNLNYMFIANVEDRSNIAFKDLEYDTRAFLFNKDSNIVLYKNTDTTYSIKKSFDSVDKIEENYTLNQYVDINLPELENPCKYDEDKYYGGTGKNISWRFITTDIPVYDTDSTSENSFPVPFIPQESSKIYYIKYEYNEDWLSYLPTKKETSLRVDNLCSFNKVCNPNSIQYDDNIISSMFRSLKRDEVYRYGIVLYDKYGNRSDVKWIADIRTPNNTEFSTIEYSNQYVAQPLGIVFTVNNLPKEVVGYQIVRCEKTINTSKNIMQVVLSRPVRQLIYSEDQVSQSNIRYTPYYPSYVLTSKKQVILTHDVSSELFFTAATSVDNSDLFLIFSPEIVYTHNDAFNNISSSVSELKLNNAVGISITDFCKNTRFENQTSGTYPVAPIDNNIINVYRDYFKNSYHRRDFKYGSYTKNETSFVFNMFLSFPTGDLNSFKIQDLKNVSNPNWNDGITNVQLSGSDITSAVLAYKSFNTSIKNKEYNNWISNGMYDLRASKDSGTNPGITEPTSSVLIGDYDRSVGSRGYIGPGPRCLILKVENNDSNLFITPNQYYSITTYVCNIQHAATQFAGLTNSDKQYDVYYGFGDYHNASEHEAYVFNGDTYIVPFELVTMYKTYNFNSYDTIPSALFIYYLPIETPINTYFDYGMNYRNTQSKNLMLEPGEITGIASQDRPQYQYNMIYSDNNRSNDIFNATSLEETNDVYPQRIFYSELKTSGESIDSWSDFKPLNYIDADTRHGQITHLLTSKDILYFWQEKAFGRLSVNERSLITDTNSNTIQLGQGGVIQRTDYISTTYGMRPQDFSAISIDGTIFWVDIKNGCIVQSNGLNAVNYSEATNVQNLMNKEMSTDIPKINYDVQNNELLCKCLNGNNQIVFNVKLNAATSKYTRDYQSMIMFDNALYGLWSNRKYNYNSENSKLKPVIIEFVVNPNSSTTKVFDNQEVVLIKNYEDDSTDFVTNKQFKFGTNIVDENLMTVKASTNKEGDIWYPIPRYGNTRAGNRIRGKWMKQTIVDNDPTNESGISHILTKYRQSFN